MLNFYAKSVYFAENGRKLPIFSAKNL